MVEPIKKYRRLYVGNEVRLYKAYYVTCTGYDLDENGEVCCVHATYDPETLTHLTEEKLKAQFTGYRQRKMYLAKSDFMKDFSMFLTQVMKRA